MQIKRTSRLMAFLRPIVWLIISNQGIGAAQDAARVERIASFYGKLPRGPAPEVNPKGLYERYQAAYFGKNPSAAREFLLTAEALDSVVVLHG